MIQAAKQGIFFHLPKELDIHFYKANKIMGRIDVRVGHNSGKLYFCKSVRRRGTPQISKTTGFQITLWVAR